MQETETISPGAAGGPAEPAPTGDLAGRAGEWAERVWSLELFTIDDTTVQVSTLVIALVVLIIGLVLAKLVSRYVGRTVLPRLRLEQGPASAV